MTRKFTIGLVQMAMTPDPAENMARAQERIRDAARQGAQVICLPELFRSRYFCQSQNAACFDLAEPIPGPTTEAMGRLAAELGAAILTPVFERRAPGLYHNSLVVIDADGQPVGLYRKMHIPDDPGYYEKYYFAPGDLGFRAFATRHGVVGPMICWDQWQPEAARLTALAGAAVLVYPTAIGWQPAEKAALGAAQHDAWRTVQRGHAIANGVYVAAINRVGWEPAPGKGGAEGAGHGGIEFWGGSFLCDPFGRVLAEAPHDQEVTLYGEIDERVIEETRRAWPFLRDRRVDAFGPLLARYLGDAETGA
jgi:N-carbamoylputrescine amidase